MYMYNTCLYNTVYIVQYRLCHTLAFSMTFASFPFQRKRSLSRIKTKTSPELTELATGWTNRVWTFLRPLESEERRSNISYLKE